MLLTTTGIQVSILEISSVFPHQEFIESHLEQIKASIHSLRNIEKPLLVAWESRVLLDGHHRFHALERLGCCYLPAVLVNEDSGIESLTSRRPEIQFTHQHVVAMARVGKRFPPKTTRYIARDSIGDINLCLSLLVPPRILEAS